MIETDGCRTIPLEENCPPNLKLTLTQTLTLTEGQFSMGAIAIVWITKKIFYGKRTAPAEKFYIVMTSIAIPLNT